MGKEFERIDTCICITEPLCCASETNTTMCINQYKMKRKAKTNKKLEHVKVSVRKIKPDFNKIKKSEQTIWCAVV